MKKFNLIIALIYSSLVIYLGLSESNSNLISNYHINDKIAHFLSFFLFYFLWRKTFIDWFENKAIIYLFFFALAFGILIEFGQNYLTNSRSAEFLDLVFNLLGVLLAHTYFNLKKRNI